MQCEQQWKDAKEEQSFLGSSIRTALGGRRDSDRDHRMGWATAKGRKWTVQTEAEIGDCLHKIKNDLQAGDWSHMTSRLEVGVGSGHWPPQFGPGIYHSLEE